MSFVLIACPGGSGGEGEDGQGVRSLSGSILRYGYGPDPRAAVEYQPDVVIVEGGASIIRRASADGFEWTIDAKAKGASKLAVGKVIFVTSKAVGRVARLARRDKDLVVVLAPVTLTEVIRNGTFSVDVPFDLDKLVMQPIPDLPGAFTDLRAPAVAEPSPAGSLSTSPSPSPQGTSSSRAAGTFTLPPLRLVGAVAQPAPTEPLTISKRSLPDPVPGSTTKATIGDFEFSFSRSGTEASIKILKKHSPILKVGAEIKMKFKVPRVKARLAINDGTMTDADYQIGGLDTVHVEFEAGSLNGLSDNIKQRFELPIDFDIPLEAGGIPLNFSTKFKFIIQTGFTAKNSTLKAAGTWEIGGDLKKNKARVLESIARSIEGVSLGVTGIVFGYEVRFMIGLGVPAAYTGLYGKFVLTTGLARGSDLGWGACRSASLLIRASAGYGVSISPTTIKFIDKLFKSAGKSKMKSDYETELWTHDLYNGSGSVPDIKLCRN